ncbi:glycosyltransferase family 2 protein [uncultured Helicobacter sp.]|uniref:glycosyltransferase family 2 protein n=1 Tax=uncultured Helicobacter sp. TaxID=175537 RepID=UPI00374F0679
MTIIFPMAGLSSRFTKAGYTKPKYMLDIKGSSVFANAVGGFSRYFNQSKIVFVYRDIQNTQDFIAAECEKLSLGLYQSVVLEGCTLGQAHTVALGLERAMIADDESILVFNIDTFRPNFALPIAFDVADIDGYLEVFEAEGDQWSFVLPSDEGFCKVAKTAEKQRISNLCSSGLYYFKNSGDFREIFWRMQKRGDFTKNELYIAPMYNYLIQQGGDVRYHKINLEEIVFCGTPQEYERLIR